MTTTDLATTCYLVLGCGESTIPAVREADSDPKNWTLVRVLGHLAIRDTEQRAERWCVKVTGVAESDFDRDHAVISYCAVYDFALALGACAGVDPRDVAQCDAAIEAMREAGAIA